MHITQFLKEDFLLGFLGLVKVFRFLKLTLQDSCAFQRIVLFSLILPHLLLLDSVELICFLLHALERHLVHLILLITGHLINQVQHTLLLQIFLLLDRPIVSSLYLHLLVKVCFLDVGLALHLRCFIKFNLYVE